jgi:hypothetical protein
MRRPTLSDAIHLCPDGYEYRVRSSPSGRTVWRGTSPVKHDDVCRAYPNAVWSLTRVRRG